MGPLVGLLVECPGARARVGLVVVGEGAGVGEVGEGFAGGLDGESELGGELVGGPGFGPGVVVAEDDGCGFLGGGGLPGGVVESVAAPDAVGGVAAAPGFAVGADGALVAGACCWEWDAGLVFWWEPELGAGVVAAERFGPVHGG